MINSVCMRDMTDMATQKYKSDHYLLEQYKNKRQPFYLSVHAVKIGNKNECPSPQIERGVALIPLVLVTTCLVCHMFSVQE